MRYPHDPEYGTFVYKDPKLIGWKRFWIMFRRFKFERITAPYELNDGDHIRLTNAFGELDRAVVTFPIPRNHFEAVATSLNYPESISYYLIYRFKYKLWICIETIVK